MSLSRTSIALQWAIDELLLKASEPCGFYLVTIPEILPWSEVSSRHRRMIQAMHDGARHKCIARFGGVRVFEEGDETGRPHVHWVMTPRISQAKVQHYADIARMGHVWLDPRPAGEYVGAYLSRYLGKGKALRGVRRWACFGEFSPTSKVKDIEISSPDIERFRDAMKEARERGMSGQEAFTFAVRLSNLRKYGYDTGLQQTQ